MRAIFFGTPDFAVPCLRALTEIAEVPLVLCQPDRPSGRGMKLTAPPVKVAAEELNLPVSQPTKVRTAAFARELQEIGADVAVVVAYGRILPAAVLAAPRLGCVNVHASLLPRWRGAAPIQWAIASGDRETGVGLMAMDEGMDTGPVLATRRLPIDRDVTAAELSVRLSELGAALLREELPRYVSGELSPVSQDEGDATMARMLKKEDGRIDWTSTADRIHDRVRGFSPWPGAFTERGDDVIKVHRTTVISSEGSDPPGSSRGPVDPVGTIVRADRHGIEVRCGTGLLRLDELQAPGRRRLPAAEFLSGYPLHPGDRLGETLQERT
ncbi:MAG: methionyl-tRNA formyltransferase [Myxococcales bacterium]|nr:methionyl-tRNA formyltransferase [Myxococcales bacterium]